MEPSYAKAERNQTELVSCKSELASVTVQLDHATQQVVGKAFRVHCHECLLFSGCEDERRARAITSSAS